MIWKIARLGFVSLLSFSPFMVQAQAYIPSQVHAFGGPIAIPMPEFDKQSGALLQPRTVRIESRPFFGRVRFGDKQTLVYFPDRYRATPDSFVYSIQDTEGYSVKVKVLINAQHQAIIIRAKRWRF